MISEFTELGLGKELVHALEKKGYSTPTPIQKQSIPVVLKGQDLLATAQTGTGKTAGFALPVLQRLSETPRSETGVRTLILTPTRELAEQIDRNIKLYGTNLNLHSVVLVGGVSIQPQRKQLLKNPEIVIATPGRLMDLMRQRLLNISKIEVLILDEADRMLDMGFIKDVQKIVARTPEKRQTLFFSATFSKEIEKLSSSMLRRPERIQIAPSATVAENLSQSVYFVEQDQKRALLTKTLKSLKGSRVLVFTRTKHRANRLTQHLSRSRISSEAIHSNKSQNARRRSLAAFDKGEVDVLVATDVVARGIDVKEISHVINYELPDDPESYIHRIGRTARASQSGSAFSFCDTEEIDCLRSIERLTKIKLDVEEDHQFHSDSICSEYMIAEASNRKPVKRPQRGRQQGGGSRGRGRGRPSAGSRSESTGFKKTGGSGRFQRSDTPGSSGRKRNSSRGTKGRRPQASF